ncbi:YbfB/YjiJ family MFS transporter [Burkholderia plantarii]|uniref:YbfB/YjiJ family MFS transporter n=1 Tax=Burkholderia plantarii TaxID=41899 RepID=UPI0018DECE09|nr:YbfB/YjiJ family MFS transporter [Burkholderia plantarii]MBI0328941.1 YbfB/YjiJ family MFS transporter [Burkholderia plantarii]
MNRCAACSSSSTSSPASSAPRPAAAARASTGTVRHADPRLVAFACAAALAVALGVGRFAFTPLLPLMLAGGALDISHGGWLASANYAGYFVGAASCAAIRLDPARMVRGGLVATIVLTAAMGAMHGFTFWLAVRFVAGAVSAWTFVFASQWGMRRLAELGASQWSGAIFTGPGWGIVVTGLIGGALAGHRAEVGWLGFALLSVLLAAPVWRVIAPAARAPTADAPAVRPGPARAPTWLPAARGEPAAGRRDARWLVVLYGAPGFGYIITATFLPVIARAALPPGSPWPDLFWPMFGAALIVGALLGSRLPAHWDNRLLLGLACAVQAGAIALGIAWPSAAGFALGSLLLGLPFTAITLFAMREARRLRGEQAAGLMGYATASYGLGQIAGPLVAAPVAAHAGSFTPALWVAIGALLAGAVGFVACGLAWREGR